MKFTFFYSLVLSLVHIQLARAQSACVLSCAKDSLSATDCGAITNVQCLCNSKAFFDAAGPCVFNKCGSADYQTSVDSIHQLCNGYATTTFTENTATFDQSASQETSSSGSGSGSGGSGNGGGVLDSLLSGLATRTDLNGGGALNSLLSDLSESFATRTDFSLPTGFNLNSFTAGLLSRASTASAGATNTGNAGEAVVQPMRFSIVAVTCLLTVAVGLGLGGAVVGL